jgi:hypothetical protein
MSPFGTGCVAPEVSSRVTAGQRFLEGYEAMQALSRGDVRLSQLLPGYRPTLATHQQRVRAVVAAMRVLGARLSKAG